MYLAKKAAMNVKNIKALPEIKMSDTAEKVLKNIQVSKNKRLLKRINEKISHSIIKSNSRYDILKEMKMKLEREKEKKKKKRTRNIFFKIRNREKIKN